MWDPRRYLDTDYGLTGDDSFEPNDEPGADLVDASVPHVRTVLGRILPEDLGVCMHFERVSPGQDDPVRLREVAGELEAYFTVGGRAMVDVTTGDRQNPAALHRLAQLVPVHLIASTGAPDGGQGHDLATTVSNEIVQGIGNTGILPGLAISPAKPALATSIARVSRDAGLTLMLVADHPQNAIAALEAIVKDGGDPARTIAGGFVDDPDAAHARELLSTGAFLSLDRVGHVGPEADRALARMVVALGDMGFGDQVLLSQRLEGPRLFASLGGQPGWIHLLERFAIQILDAGGDGAMVRRMVVDNQARALTTMPVVSS